jgi:RNA polymerase sigma-32 factor
MWWIRAAMQEFIIKAKSLVKMGTTVAQKKLFFSLNKAKNKIQGFDQSTPGLSNDHADSIANQLQVSKEDVVSMNKRMSLGDVSLDEVIDEDRSLLDTLSSEETLHDEVLSEAEDLDRKKRLLHESLKRLSPREQDVIMGRHMQETSVTLEDLSQKYNVSRERIRQIEARAMEKIQEYCSASLLPA